MRWCVLLIKENKFAHFADPPFGDLTSMASVSESIICCPLGCPPACSAILQLDHSEGSFSRRWCSSATKSWVKPLSAPAHCLIEHENGCYVNRPSNTRGSSSKKEHLRKTTRSVHISGHASWRRGGGVRAAALGVCTLVGAAPLVLPSRACAPHSNHTSRSPIETRSSRRKPTRGAHVRHEGVQVTHVVQSDEE